MANANNIRDFGDLTDALYARRNRMNGLYAAIYGFGEHQSQDRDFMFGGIIQLCRDIADEAEKLLDECERMCREEKSQHKSAEETAKSRVIMRTRLRDILLRNENADANDAAA